MQPLEPDEFCLQGQWTMADGKIVADDTSRRINELIASTLTKLAVSQNGRDILYVDKRDGRLWELTCPQSEWQGGGPPALTCIDDDVVAAKYKFNLHKSNYSMLIRAVMLSLLIGLIGSVAAVKLVLWGRDLGLSLVLSDSSGDFFRPLITFAIEAFTAVVIIAFPLVLLRLWAKASRFRSNGDLK